MTWLGIAFNTLDMAMTLTHTMIHEVQECISEWQGKTRATPWELQSLFGLLQFVSYMALPVNVFTNRILVLYNWLIWRVLKLAFFFQKSIFPVFILASGAVRTTPYLCRHIFMRSLIWRWWAFAKIRQIKNHAKLTSYTVLEAMREHFYYPFIGFSPRPKIFRKDLSNFKDIIFSLRVTYPLSTPLK